MSAIPVTNPASEMEWKLPARGPVAMYSLIAAETAIFTIFVVAYLFYIGKITAGPNSSILHIPVFLTVCLLSSSLTVHFAGSALARGKVGAFNLWWFLTIALGAIFLAGTALEWRHLIADEGLTIRTNLFGTIYYSLVGLHAFHVTVGLLALITVALFALFKAVTPAHAERVEVLGLYWHFVDAVWVVVFTVVYIVGR
jgi:cytochrome c oxidase subunit III